jgi:hypothetical protein
MGDNTAEDVSDCDVGRCAIRLGIEAMNEPVDGLRYRAFAALCGAIIKGRLWVAALVLALTAMAVWQLPRLELDTSNEIWFVEGHPALDALREFERLFRNDDFVYVVLGTEDVFQPPPVEILTRRRPRGHRSLCARRYLAWQCRVRRRA